MFEYTCAPGTSFRDNEDASIIVLAVHFFCAYGSSKDKCQAREVSVMPLRSSGVVSDYCGYCVKVSSGYNKQLGNQHACKPR